MLWHRIIWPSSKMVDKEAISAKILAETDIS